jgi:hypothetical protein
MDLLMVLLALFTTLFGMLLLKIVGFSRQKLCWSLLKDILVQPFSLLRRVRRLYQCSQSAGTFGMPLLGQVVRDFSFPPVLHGLLLSTSPKG